jgi:hypothetical protein
MSTKGSVNIDKIAIKAEAAGLRVCLEAIVPPELFPDPDEESPEQSQCSALALIEAQIPAIISRQLLRHIARSTSFLSGQAVDQQIGDR